jgi:hypothetical protein
VGFHFYSTRMMLLLLLLPLLLSPLWIKEYVDEED